MSRRLPNSARPLTLSMAFVVPVMLVAWIAFATVPNATVTAQDESQSEQADSEQADSDQAGGDEKDEQFHEKFWQYLNEVEYTKWQRFPAGDEGFSEGKSPHGALLKTYANKVASENPQELPVKSILVKHNYNEDEELIAITPMYRVGNDYDPDHNDWFWAKYKPDGTIFEDNGKKMSGRLEGCIECHSKAGGEDYVFNNDD